MYTVVFIGVAIKSFNEPDWAKESLYTGTQHCNAVFWLCLNHYFFIFDRLEEIKVPVNPQ